MGKVLIACAAITALLIGSPASASSVFNETTSRLHSTASTTPVLSPSPGLARAYDALPNGKSGSAVAAHIRKITLEARSTKSPKFEVVMSPTVNKVQVRNSVGAYERAMKIWQPLGVDKLNLTWVFMSENDYDWWLNRVEKFETEKTEWDTKVWNPKTKELGHCKLDAFSFCGYGNPKPSGKSFQYNLIGSRYSTAPNANTVNHEAVHFYQDSIETGLKGMTPCWFVEGQANLFGNVLDQSSRTASNRQRELSRVRESIPDAPKLTSNTWVAELKSLDGPRRDFCIKTELSYSLGMFIFESLYSNYSFRQMHELVLAISESGSFSKAVEQTLGTTQEALYSDIAKYLAKQFRG
jgi:hypothetical protein